MVQSLEPCPVCGSRKLVPIVYGLPLDETMEEARRGEVALGGCCISGDDPRWLCSDCGSRGPPWPKPPSPSI